MNTFMCSRSSCTIVQKLGPIGPLVQELWLMETLELSPELQVPKVGFALFTRKLAPMAQMRCNLVRSFVELLWTPKKILKQIPRGVWDLCRSM